MPTNPASIAIAPCMRSASAASAASASGRAFRRFMLIEVSLQEQLCGDAIAQPALVARLHSGHRELLGSGLTAVTLVRKCYRDAEPAFEPSGESLRPVCHLMRGLIGMGRQSHQKERRLPFIDQCSNGSESL